MKTFSAKPAEVTKKWVLIDAKGLVVGRLATIVAMRLRGKHLPTYTPHVDCGDFVVIVNADKIEIATKRAEQKIYLHHTGYPGGLKTVQARDVQAKYPERIVESAVRGMLPKSKLGRKQLKKLKVYRGPKHPHEAQQPRPLKIEAARASGQK